MNPRPEDELMPELAAHVRAATAVPETDVARAQLRLQRRLAETGRTHATKPVAPRRGWLAATATAMAALVLAIGLPLLSGGGDAFAAAQRRFGDFRTLQMTVTTRANGAVLQTSRTTVDHTGASRTDVGTQLSIVVDPARGRMLTLLHDSREAMALPLAAGRPASGEPDWVEEVRTFQGEARPIAETRLIDGVPARGWRLVVHGQALELWTDADGLPLQMLVAASAIALDYRFVFDAPIAPGTLSTDVPAGYAAVAPDED